MTDIINVYQPVPYDESVSHYEIYFYLPYNSTRFENNDEIRITIQHQELNVSPSESSLYISGKICNTSNESQKPTSTSLVNNAKLHLFEQVRYELNGAEIDRSKRVGLTSTMKGWVSHNPAQTELLQNAGWITVSFKALIIKV